MKTTLLIDGDIFAYEAAAAAEEVINWGDHKTKHLHHGVETAGWKCDKRFDELAKKFKADIVVCLSCRTEDGWRKAILPTYKHNRDPDAKPVLLSEVKDYIRENWPIYERPTLEADDVMGILSTSSKIIPGKKIIVSIDKDMKTIPGWLYSPMHDTKPRLISEEDADYWHLYQTLVGDSTDGYKGCPGVGPKKAEAILDYQLAGIEPERQAASMWAGVLRAYEAKKLTEEDALLQARVARICRNTDYDFSKKEVKLWTPK